MRNQHPLTHWPAALWRPPTAALFTSTAGWAAAGGFWAELIKAALASFDPTQWLHVRSVSPSTPRFGLRWQGDRFIVADTISGAVIYTPPDFILAKDEGEFASLLAILNSGGDRLEAVLAYEARAARCKDKGRYLQRYTPSRSLKAATQRA
ncbi:hypothetical protein [Methylobacterium oxalidis]|uniref:hypothetical protein n=1 Tax=Methylobacterium oxalidis TaxID=944322 RepID=UPI003315F893